MLCLIIAAGFSVGQVYRMQPPPPVADFHYRMEVIPPHEAPRPDPVETTAKADRDYSEAIVKEVMMRAERKRLDRAAAEARQKARESAERERMRASVEPVIGDEERPTSGPREDDGRIVQDVLRRGVDDGSIVTPAGVVNVVYRRVRSDGSSYTQTIPNVSVPRSRASGVEPIITDLVPTSYTPPQAVVYPQAVQWAYPTVQSSYRASGIVCGPNGCGPSGGLFARMLGR